MCSGVERWRQDKHIGTKIDDVVSVVVTLFLACQLDVFPQWAQALLGKIDTTFIEKIECLRSTP